jgi:hypothetical protein
LKATKHGAPFTHDEDVPEAIRSTSAGHVGDDHTDKFHFKRWDYVLNEMIWAFDQYNKNWESKFHKGKKDILWQAQDKDFKPIGKPVKHQDKPVEGAEWYELVKGPKDTSFFDKEGYDKHQARIQNGLRLFGRYYSNLWD